jgi:hypothetical protein
LMVEALRKRLRVPEIIFAELKFFLRESYLKTGTSISFDKPLVTLTLSNHAHPLFILQRGLIGQNEIYGPI